MKRLVIAFMALAAVAPPAASAHENSARLVPVVVSGEHTTSRSASGSCAVAGARTGDDLLMRCGRGSGAAVAKYDFTLPSRFVGQPAFAVSSTRLSCRDCSIRTRLVHLDDRHYRVTVTVSGSAQLDVRSVRFSYYVS